MEAIGSNPNTCPTTMYPYGVYGSTLFWLEAADGEPVISSNIKLTPWDYWGTSPGVALDAVAQDGTFTYQYYGVCSTSAFPTTLIGSDMVKIELGSTGIYYTVRQQNWWEWSDTPYKGDLFNDQDVDVNTEKE